MVGKAQQLTREVLEAHFHLPMAEVAKKYAVCLTYFKKLCRRHGITRWPYRQVKSIERRCPGGEEERATYIQGEATRRIQQSRTPRARPLSPYRYSDDTESSPAPSSATDEESDEESKSTGKRKREDSTQAIDVLAMLASTLAKEARHEEEEEESVEEEQVKEEPSHVQNEMLVLPPMAHMCAFCIDHRLSAPVPACSPAPVPGMHAMVQQALRAKLMGAASVPGWPGVYDMPQMVPVEQ